MRGRGLRRCLCPKCPPRLKKGKLTCQRVAVDTQIPRVISSPVVRVPLFNVVRRPLPQEELAPSEENQREKDAINYPPGANAKQGALAAGPFGWTPAPLPTQPPTTVTPNSVGSPFCCSGSSSDDGKNLDEAPDEADERLRGNVSCVFRS